MKTINLSELYTLMQQEMLQKLRSGKAAFVHPGTKGDNTEANWIEWLRAYLPKRYCVDKGTVIDSTGRESDQIDLIIYDAQYSYFVFHQGESLLIPAESVYAVFEVKQNLNKQHIEYAGKKAKSVRELLRTSAPIRYANGSYSPKKPHEIVAGILTTNSDWQSPIAPNVVRYIEERPYDERLDFVCSISDNTFAVGNNVFIEDYKADYKPQIQFCEQNESLVYLLLKLLKRLQDIGTVPAIDFNSYIGIIKEKTYKT